MMDGIADNQKSVDYPFTCITYSRKQENFKAKERVLLRIARIHLRN
jgi:hypothetical protein